MTLVTGTLSPVHASCCPTGVTTEIRISAFSLFAGFFKLEVQFSALSYRAVAVCDRLFYATVVQLLWACTHHFQKFFARCVMLFSLLLFAWMRTHSWLGKCGRPALIGDFAIHGEGSCFVQR